MKAKERKTKPPADSAACVCVTQPVTHAGEPPFVFCSGKNESGAVSSQLLHICLTAQLTRNPTHLPKDRLLSRCFIHWRLTCGSFPMDRQPIIVFFDLETTGLDTSVCDIVQLAAVCEDRVFNEYTLPRRELTESATQVTGFTVSPAGLFLRGQPVRTTPLVKLLVSFIEFLRSFGGPVVLAAHSGKRFDAPVLTRVLCRYDLQRDFQQVVSGFLDTFLLCKKIHPNLPKYSQQDLVSRFLKRSYNAHDAREDASMLQELYKAWSPKHSDVLRFTFRANML